MHLPALQAMRHALAGTVASSAFILSALAMSTIAYPGLAAAADFRVETWRGHEVLRMTGEISAGSADRFAAASDKIKALPHGLPVLLLDSPGGSVDEAMKISAAMQKTPFHTVVPDGAACASACASIIFIAGENRTVEPFGVFGQHSCSSGGVPNRSCNDRIAQHAFDNGVSYGSVDAFITFAQPKDIVWFSREDVDGWGLTRYPRERENGFEKSEPRVMRLFLGRMPEAQTIWRIDFHKDGYRAFSRTHVDHEREMQLNLFCRESNPGRLFLSMEITGDATVIERVMRRLAVATDRFGWVDDNPLIRQMDSVATEVVTEIPREHILPFLREAASLEFAAIFDAPYVPMVAKTRLDGSRDALIFAANNCESGTYSE